MSKLKKKMKGKYNNKNNLFYMEHLPIIFFKYVD